MQLSSIDLGQPALSDFEKNIHKEWLLTNGLGGYASSTILGINTRKYHGLLVAALNPPGDRTVCLSKLDEDAIIGNDACSFGANQFQDKIFPQGHLFLKHFSVSPFPTYTYNAKDIELRKTIYMPKEKNAIAAIYQILNRNESEAKIRIFPLITSRYFHSTINREQNAVDYDLQPSSKEVEISFKAPKKNIIVLRITKGVFTKKTNWVNRLWYQEENRRGESCTDDCLQPGYFEFSIPARREEKIGIVAIACNNRQKLTEERNSFGLTFSDIADEFLQELKQKEELIDKFRNLHPEVPRSDWLDWILQAADSFIVNRKGDQKAIIAGYFWFGSWGRDTFISLPGLMLVTGRFEDAKKVFLDYSTNVYRGLIPNFLSDTSGDPAYNTVDATLWFLNAVLQFLKYTGDFDFVKQNLWENMKAIIEYHEKGTSFGIKLDDDGLLAHNAQLTWMDAEINGKPTTPRSGKAIEIQALWYNALKTMELLAQRFEEPKLSEKYQKMANKARLSFNEKFWNKETNCLFDVVEGARVDLTIRPNQVIALALDFTIVDADKRRNIISTVLSELVTPFGLRTLSSKDWNYKGEYIGNRQSRDQAYHNGTVWPWLLGPFVSAFLKTKQYEKTAIEYTQRLLLNFFTQQILKGGLGQINEIFDGDLPHLHRGCIAQAWSVAEPLRAFMEEVSQIRPKYAKMILQT